MFTTRKWRSGDWAPLEWLSTGCRTGVYCWAVCFFFLNRWRYRRKMFGVYFTPALSSNMSFLAANDIHIFLSLHFTSFAAWEWNRKIALLLLPIFISIDVCSLCLLCEVSSKTKHFIVVRAFKKHYQAFYTLQSIDFGKTGSSTVLWEYLSTKCTP